MANSLPTFVRVKDYIWLYEPPADALPLPAAKASVQPDTILLCTWLNGGLRQIAKYTEGYKALYPNARIVVVQSTQGDLARFIEQVQARMVPVIELVFGPPSAPNPAATRVLVQNFSNGGSRNLEGTLRAYKQLYGKPMAPVAVLHDSTPSNPAMDVQMKVAAGMFTHTLPKFYPARVAVHYAYVFAMWLIYALPTYIGYESMLAFMRRELVDPELLSTKTRRAYIYGKADVLVDWPSVLSHAADARANGFTVQTFEFEGSGHVAHMKGDPDRYWKIVSDTWDAGISRK